MSDSSPAEQRILAEREERESLLHSIREQLESSPQLLEDLRRWHDLTGWLCSAGSEGLLCCVDYLLGETPAP